jgi:hypothetical protein
MPKYYCGGKLDVRSNRATSPKQCSRQIRAYGRRVVKDADAIRSGVRSDLLQDAGTGSRCGSKNGNARQDDCRRQIRLYGLLPALEAASDLRRRTFFAKTPEDYERLPPVTGNGTYATKVLENRNSRSRDCDLVFTSVGVPVEGSDVHPPWSRDPQRQVGGVGYAFGYFSKTRSYGVRYFYIVRVHVNPPYRRGLARASKVASWVLREFVKSVEGRARSLYPKETGHPLTLEIDSDATCFQIGNRQHMTARESASLTQMYEDAGFEILDVSKIEGVKGRRKVRYDTFV